MSKATDELTQVFWENPKLRRIAQLAIAEIDVLAAQRDACLSACRAVVDVTDCLGRGLAIVLGHEMLKQLDDAIALCELDAEGPRA